MPFTARLPQALQHEAQAFAEALGISLNALLAVSLRDYLDGRRAPPRPAEASVGLPVVLEVQAPAVLPLKPSARVWRAPKRLRDRCPCGSGQQWRHCHGKPK